MRTERGKSDDGGWGQSDVCLMPRAHRFSKHDLHARKRQHVSSPGLLSLLSIPYAFCVGDGEVDALSRPSRTRLFT